MAPASAQGREEEDAEEKEEEEVEEKEEEEEAPSHLPLAPSSELFDTSTTVDPSYVISLIRKLLPHDVMVEQSQTVNNHGTSVQGSEVSCLEQSIMRDHNCEDEMDATEDLEDLNTHKKLTDNYEKKGDHHFIDQETSSTIDNGMDKELGENGRTGSVDDGQTGLSEMNDPWEECGCILWDLSASRNHAEFMVKNLLLEVLLANLHVSKSFRVTEICLGIIGNLACHDALSYAITSTNGLIEAVVEQLFLDDSTCLSEMCRLLTVGLQGSGFASWAEALLPENKLLRILWIAGNTLNPMLLEKSIELLLAIVERQEVATILQSLTELGLPDLLLSLLACEISKSRDENQHERSFILDLVLRLVEALTTIDNCSQVISSNEKLFHLVCGVIKLPDKIEVAGSCASAVVIIANILTDEQRLTSDIAQDFSFLHGLFDIFPLVSDDSQARNALWCILARLLTHIQENYISISTLHQYASLFLEKSYLIEEDLKGHSTEDFIEDQKKSPSSSHGNLYGTTTSLRKIVCILERWNKERSAVSEKDVVGRDDDDDDGKFQRLLHYCRKYNA